MSSLGLLCLSQLKKKERTLSDVVINFLNHRLGVIVLILYGDRSVAKMFQGNCPIKSPYALFTFIALVYAIDRVKVIHKNYRILLIRKGVEAL